MHALIVLQILSVLGTLSATVPMKRGNGLEPSQDRHSKALEGRSAVAFHFKRLAQHQTNPPTKATRVSALPKTIVKKTPSVKKSPPAKARLPYTTAKKSLVRKTLRASSKALKALKKKVCRRADNAQTGASCSTTVETLTGGPATPPAEPSCNEIETCLECIQNDKCEYGVGKKEPLLRCTLKTDIWGYLIRANALAPLHCDFFEQVSLLTKFDIAHITRALRRHMFEGNPNPRKVEGSHLETVFQRYLQEKNLTYNQRRITANGIILYNGVRPSDPRDHREPRPIYTTWDSVNMYTWIGVLKMCQIAAHYSLQGRVAVPNSSDGALVCIQIVTKAAGAWHGTCFPLAVEITPDTEPGKAC